MKKSERTKEDMIHAVITLIEESGSIDMTISQIAQRAEVAVGLINYHYKSKQALIIDAVKNYVEEQIEKDNVFMLGEVLPPRDLLAASFKSYADFLADHSVISRLHIMYGLDGKIDGSAMSQATTYYLPIVKGINASLSDMQGMTALTMIVSTLQLSFLEAELAKQTIGFDFYEKEDRDGLIENMIAMIIK